MKISDILRWIVLVPASLVAPFLILFPVHWFLILAGWNDDQWFGLVTMEAVEYVLSGYAAPLGMILTAHFIAPKAKYEAALFAAGVWTTMYLIGLVYVIVKFSFDGWQWARIACMTIATVIAVAMPFHKIDRETGEWTQ